MRGTHLSCGPLVNSNNAIANPNKLNLGSLYPSPGSQLRIPINISGIVASYNELNEL